MAQPTSFLLVLFLGLFASSCTQNQPSKEVLEDVAQLQCDMGTEEVERVLGSLVVEMSGRWKGWITHSADIGRNSVWLGFENDGLKFVQVTWNIRLSEVGKLDRIELCK